MRVLLCLIHLVLLLTGRAISQTNTLRFDHITTEQGLSQDIVVTIVQDRHGFMWFATEDGLNRYDGYSMKVYKHNPRDSTSVPSDMTMAMYVDLSGTLWIASSDGLCRYNEDTDRFVRISHSADVTSLAEDDRGRLLIGTGNGLAELDRKNDLLIPTPDGPPGIRTLRMRKGREGDVWIGTERGLYRYHSSTQKAVVYDSGTEPIKALEVDAQGNLWYAAGNEGLRRVTLRTNVEERFRLDPRNGRSLVDDRVLSLCEDRQGNLWVGTFSGLERFDPATGGFLHFNSDPDDPRSLKANRVYAIYQNRDGSLWIGTYRGGVSRMDPYNQKFAHTFQSAFGTGGPRGKDVLSLLEDSRGELWVGTDLPGLELCDGQSRRFTSMFSDRARGVSVAIAEDRRGRIWVGTQGTGLLCYDRKGNTVREYRHDASRPSGPFDDNVRSLYVDRDGVLWVGYTTRGLDRYNERTDSFTHFDPDGQNAQTGIWCIQEDRSGMLWLGAMYAGTGVYKFDRSSSAFTPIRVAAGNSPASSIASVRGIHEDADGVLWFGTWKGGLYRFDPSTDSIRQFREIDGLCNNYVKGMLADEKGKLWISTENGLSRFDPVRETFKNFTVRDGLQSNFFWSGSFCRGRDGTLYFGGTNGFNAFHPDSIRDNPNIPPVVITGFHVLNDPVPLTQYGRRIDEVRLSHDQDFFSFEFVALSYTAPEKNQYAYFMQGFDRGWIQAGTRRYAAYTHLDPGSYTFRVKGSNNDGVWNEEGASLSIVILPPFWQTWWFRVLAVLSVASTLYGIYAYRVRRIVVMERLRARIAADLHDDVGSELGHIALASQLLARKVTLPEKEHHQLTSIGTSALHASDMMKEIVWLLNPKNDALHDIVLKMKTVAEEQLHGIDYNFDAPRLESTDRVALQVKRNVFLMYKEVLHNIVKHARATKVSIQVQLHARRLSFAVLDNGVGFDPAHVVPGNGLGNLRNRAAQIGGSLSIASEQGKGTRVDVSVRI
jgi:ligand-binding sensor domain-containing protein/signal transduction histidine kinase